MLRARYCTDLAETTLERKIRNLIQMLGSFYTCVNADAGGVSPLLEARQMAKNQHS
jgi:hypothetical protein